MKMSLRVQRISGISIWKFTCVPLTKNCHLYEKEIISCFISRQTLFSSIHIMNSLVALEIIHYLKCVFPMICPSVGWSVCLFFWHLVLMATWSEERNKGGYRGGTVRVRPTSPNPILAPHPDVALHQKNIISAPPSFYVSLNSNILQFPYLFP